MKRRLVLATTIRSGLLHCWRLDAGHFSPELCRFLLGIESRHYRCMLFDEKLAQDERPLRLMECMRADVELSNEGASRIGFGGEGEH